MGKSKKGPIIEARDRLLLEFTDGSACMSEGQKLSYTTLIHLVCHRGAIVSPVCHKTNLWMFSMKLDVIVFLLLTLKVKSPQFELSQNCTAVFIWETKAACAIQTVENNVRFPHPPHFYTCSKDHLFT